MIVIRFQITTPYPRVPVPAGIEPATLRLTAVRSNQLSYRTQQYNILSQLYKRLAPTQDRTGVDGS